MVFIVKAILGLLNVQVLYSLVEYLEDVKKVNKYFKYVVGVICSIIIVSYKDVYLYVTHDKISAGVSAFIGAVVLMLVIHILYRLHISKVIMLYIVFMLGAIVSDIVTSIVMLVVFKYSEVGSNTTLDILGGFIGICILSATMYISRKVLKLSYNNIVKFVNKKYNKKVTTILIQVGYPILFIIALAIIFVDLYSSGSIDLSILVVIAILSLGQLVHSVHFVNSVVKDKIQAKEYEIQKVYIDSFSGVLEDIKIFWHGYSNIIQVLKVYLSSDKVDTEDLIETLRSILNKEDKENLTSKVRLVSIKHPVVAGILTTKSLYAEKLGVTLDMQSIGSSAVNMQMADLIDVLGVLLDNAIEAAYFSDIKTVSISLEFNKGLCAIDIMNFVARDDNQKAKKYGKSNNIGLNIVKSILLKYDNVIYSVYNRDELYKVHLEISEGFK